MLEGTFQAYDRVNQLPDYLPPVRYPRTPGYRPGADENPLNAWAVKTEVQRRARTGRSSGKRVVLKDNICLAGVPMMNGASTLEGYVPDIDATVVDAHPRRRRHDRRQGALRVFLPVRRQPHLGARAGAQSVQARLFGRRLVVGLRRAGRRRRSRDGDRRRPGRLDPDAGVVFAAATA